MANKKFDGLIEAVRYAPDGKIELVRAYERRGATFSDHILISRVDLVARLMKGEKFVTGLRKEFLGSTFESAKIVRMNGDVISTGSESSRDLLEEVPIL
ncbi:MAG: hypothetical protein NT121_12945 [Chloroflexi bacterium]|nr:hypothetical protein [Chloroflexota bacterium]